MSEIMRHICISSIYTRDRVECFLRWERFHCDCGRNSLILLSFELCLWLDTNVKGDIDMAFLNENEWIRLNEIAYNISFIYTVEEMQHEILNRWLPFLISYDSAIFARISTAENGSYQFQAPAAFHLPQQAVDVWMQESLNSDAFRWALYTCKGGAGNLWHLRMNR